MVWVMAGPNELDLLALHRRHRDALLGMFVRRTLDVETALDLWAETFAQAIAGQRRFRGDEDDAARWLYTIAHRQLAYYYRRGYARQRAMQKLALERPPASEDLEAALLQRAEADRVRGELTVALAQLSPKARQAVELRVVDELPFAEVAERMAIKEPAARALVSRGLRALATSLDPETLAEGANA